MTYLILLRGVNVGGKNKVSMAELKKCLEGLGFLNVSTFINSGNIILDSSKTAVNIKNTIEKALPQTFKLDSELIKALVLTPDDLKNIVKNRPKDFGDNPQKYYSDAIFMMDISVDEAIKVFDPREGVDKIWPGKGVIYSQRLGAERTKSKLSKIMLSPLYKSMTIRSWSTVTKLLGLLEK